MAELVKDFWEREMSGVYRQARKDHTCGTSREGCGQTITAGSRYFDTCEIVDPPFKTLKYCELCAQMERKKFEKQRPHDFGNYCNCFECRT